MRTILLFITGLLLGLLLTEMINIYGYLLYDQTFSLKFFPILLGIMLVGINHLLNRKSKLPHYKSSLH